MKPMACALMILLLGDELLVLPLVSERRSTAEGFPESRAHRRRCCDTSGDLLALPLRHRRDHGVEEAAGRG